MHIEFNGEDGNHIRELRAGMFLRRCIYRRARLRREYTYGEIADSLGLKYVRAC
jgi:hypothetical protein